MDKKREKITRYSLITGEDTYASQTAQNPVTSRRLKSLIPSAAGDLSREPFQAQYNANALGGPVGSLYQFDHNDGNGNVTSFYFAASATVLYQSDGSNWNVVSAVGTLNNFPQFVTINNLLHMSDGVNNWLFDGTNWVIEGFPIPPPSFRPSAIVTPVGTEFPTPTNTITAVSRAAGFAQVTMGSSVHYPEGYNGVGALFIISGLSDSSFNGVYTGGNFTLSSQFTYPNPGPDVSSTAMAGTLTVLSITATIGKYYWMTYADHTANRIHESSTSLISSIVTGALSSSVVRVLMTAGSINVVSGSPIVQGVGTNFSAQDIGLQLLTLGSPFQPGIGKIIAVDVLRQKLTLNTNSLTTVSGESYLTAPLRATHINFYASESESSKVGFFLGSIDIGTAVTTTGYFDQSPFLGQPNSQYTQVNRPVRNDPSPGSGICEVHKYRIWRRRESKPNFFLYSANEEVASSINGSPQESFPGADVNTKSDIINETSFPSQSNRLRSIVSHADALYLATEKQCLPLYGDSIDDFAISQVSAFSVGSAGRWAMISTPHGLAFMSYDRKLYLYPTSNYPWAYVPKDVNVTESLIEIGKPLRKTFEQIKGSDLDNVRLCFYNYGRRNWLVVCYQDVNSVYHTWIYDFEIKNWFELSRGFTSVAVFDVGTPSRGKVLIGGGTDGKTYVIDDLTGSATPGVFPLGTWRPALIDFGSPDEARIARYVEFEVSNAALAQFITVNYYLDPVDVDNPGVARPITMSKVRGSNLYRGFFKGGSYCKRLLLEFLVAANTTDGVIRGVVLKADEVSGLVF